MKKDFTRDVRTAFLTLLFIFSLSTVVVIYNCRYTQNRLGSVCVSYATSCFVCFMIIDLRPAAAVDLNGLLPGPVAVGLPPPSPPPLQSSCAPPAAALAEDSVVVVVEYSAVPSVAASTFDGEAVTAMLVSDSSGEPPASSRALPKKESLSSAAATVEAIPAGTSLGLSEEELLPIAPAANAVLILMPAEAAPSVVAAEAMVAEEDEADSEPDANAVAEVGADGPAAGTPRPLATDAGLPLLLLLPAPRLLLLC